jgi:uncharacterized protein (TIGR02246 family)
MRFTKLCASLLAVSLAGCANSANPAADKATEAKALNTLGQQFKDAVAKKDAAAVAALFTTDGVAQYEGMPTVKGQQAVQQTFGEMFKDPNAALTWQDDGEPQIANSGDLAYSYGTYDMTMSAPDGKPAHDKGKFVTVMKKVDGGWKVALDAANSDVPMMPVPAPAATPAPATKK